MPKRKREGTDDSATIKQQRTRHKLKAGVTKIGHAFKVSKGLERQKLARRRKKAETESNGKEVDRIDSEINALKALDTTTSAQHHLYKSLLKIKAVSDSPGLPAEVRDTINVPKDAATLNVNARLCKSNLVQEAVSIVLVDIQQSLGLDVQQSKYTMIKKGKSKTAASSPLPLSHNQKSNDSPVHRAWRDMSPISDDADEGLDHIESGSPSDHEDEAREANSPERLQGTRATKKGHESKQNGYSVEADLSISESELDDASISPEPQKVSSTKKSAFIPSLTMAGYISGSESEIEDDLAAPVKKNRRGQRARQQIWEQKYGSKAKHLQKQDRDAGWNAKRGAVDNADGKGSRGRTQRTRRMSPDYMVGGDGRDPQSRAAGNAKKKEKINDGPIHPSWEAAKRAKEKRDAPVAFQGKKITFD